MVFAKNRKYLLYIVKRKGYLKYLRNVQIDAHAESCKRDVRELSCIFTLMPILPNIIEARVQQNLRKNQ